MRKLIPNRQRESRRGAALVELALILPIFFMVVLGIIEFGRAMMVSQLVTNAAREGARMAILDGSSNSQVETWVKDFLTTSLNVSADVLTVDITVTPAQGNPSAGNEVANASPRDLCMIKVSVPFSEVDYIPSKYLGSKSLMGQSAMRHE